MKMMGDTPFIDEVSYDERDDETWVEADTALEGANPFEQFNPPTVPDPSYDVEPYDVEPDERIKVRFFSEYDAKPADTAVTAEGKNPFEQFDPPEPGPNPFEQFGQSVWNRKSIVENFGEGVNLGISHLIGAPVDLANIILGHDEPLGGSESLKRLFEWTGVGATPDSGYMGSIGRVTGEALVGFGILGGFAKLTPVAQHIALQTKRRFFEPMLNAVRSHPYRTALMELGIAWPIGATGELFSSFGEGARPYGELVGGLAPASTFALTSKAFRGLADDIGISRAAQERRIPDIFRDVADPTTIERMEWGDVDLPQYGEPSTGRAYNDPGLIALERGVDAADPKLVARSQDYLTRSNQSLLSAIKTLAPGDDTSEFSVKFFGDRINRAVQFVEARVGEAINASRTEINKLGAKYTDFEASQIARGRLKSALDDAREREKTEWTAIGYQNYDVFAIIGRARLAIESKFKAESSNEYSPIFYELSRKPDLPEGAINELGVPVKTAKPMWDDVESIGEILALRSRVLNAIAAERAAGRFNRARILRTELLDPLFNDIVPVRRVGTGKAARWEKIDDDPILGAVTKARDFSKSLNDTFTRGPIGKLFEYDTSRDFIISPERTLYNMIEDPTFGVLGLQAMRKAAGDEGAAEIDDAVQEFLKALYAASITDHRGTFLPKAGLRFVEKHSRVLDEFPELKEQMSNAATGRELAEAAQKGLRTRITNIKVQSTAAKYINGEPSAQARSVLTSKSPVSAAAKIMAKAKKDPTGNAVRGVRSAMTEVILDTVAPYVNAARDVVGDPKVIARPLRTLLKNKKAALKKIYGAGGVAILEQVEAGLTVNMRQSLGIAEAGGSDTVQKLSTIGGTLGIILGARLNPGAHGLMWANVMRKSASGLVQRLLSMDAEQSFNILQQALKEPEFAARLLRVDALKKLTAAQEISLMRYASMKTALSVAPEQIGEFDDVLQSASERASQHMQSYPQPYQF